ncbi:hypothetical protein HPB47_005850 [Ixodes persulcatus]|uniref:Uncharacterized protein n=1 Tax=Ixodes persulcatus TaxID=34615 RepID=A0AC60PBW2_IXOPE|nr:hypothetical protein HPB47_005850 [Ixodes persulcatus]
MEYLESLRARGALCPAGGSWDAALRVLPPTAGAPDEVLLLIAHAQSALSASLGQMSHARGNREPPIWFIRGKARGDRPCLSWRRFDLAGGATPGQGEEQTRARGELRTPSSG